MDKKTIIGLLLMVAVFVGFSFYQNYEMEKYEEYRREKIAEQQREAATKATEEEAARMLEEAMSEEERHIRDSVEQARKLNAELYAYGEELLAARNAMAEVITVENDVMKVDFNTRGGMIQNVTLKNYTKYAEGERNELVEMMQPETARFYTLLKTQSGTETLSNEYVFTPTISEGEAGAKVVTMSLSLSQTASLDYVYTIYDTKEPSRDYLIDFRIDEKGIKPYLRADEELVVEWQNRSNHNERSYETENMATTIAYYSEDDGEEEIDADGERDEYELVDWVAFKQQYFSSVLFSAEPMTAELSFKNSQHKGVDFMKEYYATLRIPFNEQQSSYNFAFYYGPNDFKIMKGVMFDGEKSHLDDIIPMGGWLVGWINRWLTIPVFHWLRDNGLNFGIIILILTLMVKVIILPLTYKSYMSTAKMRAIRPELDELNRKYPNQDDAMKKQQAMMELYQKAGINPMGGCLPMLIQMPILWAMFRFFPASIELRGESFLWADDLSSYDSVLNLPFNIPFYGDHISLFALLMAVALFGYSFISYKQQSATTAGQPGAGMMKFMMVYFMPVMMLFFFNNYSSGLCYYYFLSQIMTMIIMYAIRRSVDDEKVRAKLFSEKAKKKKSKFQERYEEALRQQQETLNREQRRMRH